MNKLYMCLMMLVMTSAGLGQKTDTRYFELRIYHCFPGKLPNLVERFTNHTTRIFEKHHMENIGYWLPVHNENNDLYYILAYPDKVSRDSSWSAFGKDPEWQDVARKSEEAGKIVEKVTSVFMTTADIPFALQTSAAEPNRTFELRTYFCPAGKLPNLEKRFAEHTLELFKKHHMESVGYWKSSKSDGSQPELVYIIAHKNEDQAVANWTAFRADPDWVKAKADSEKDGPIVEKTESVFLQPLPFSKIK